MAKMAIFFVISPPRFIERAEPPTARRIDQKPEEMRSARWAGEHFTSPVVQPASPEMPRTASDRYQLLGEVARGGMGVILKGRDPRLGRDMAFKVLKTEHIGKPTAEQRFVEEAQVGGQLQHPGIHPVYD